MHKYFIQKLYIILGIILVILQLNLIILADLDNKPDFKLLNKTEITFSSGQQIESIFEKIKRYKNPNIVIIIASELELNNLVYPFEIEVEQNSSLKDFTNTLNLKVQQIINNLLTIKKDSTINTEEVVLYDSYDYEGKIKNSKSDKLQEIEDNLNIRKSLQTVDFQIKQSFKTNKITIVSENKEEINAIKNLFSTTKKLKLNKKIDNKKIKLLNRDNLIKLDPNLNSNDKLIPNQKSKNIPVKDNNSKKIEYTKTNYTDSYFDEVTPIIASNDKEEILNNSTEDSNIFSKVASLFSIQASARGLNNSREELILYNWNNNNLVLDLPNNNLNNGQQFKVWTRNGSSAQYFTFDNTKNNIKIRGKCLDLSEWKIQNGTPIHVWDCTNDWNQKFFFDGIYLRLWNNPNYCIDANGGFNQGSNIQLYQCNGSQAQRFVAGKNDFGTSYGVSIRASGTGYYGNGVQTGHVFLSFSANGELLNTMSSWPGYDTDCNNESPVQNSKRNNICDNDAAFIDRDDDRRYYIDSLAGSNKSFRSRYLLLTKRISDVYRFNSGYRYALWDYGRSNINYSGAGIDNNNGNCASFSSRVWNDIMDDMGQTHKKVPFVDIPGVINLSLPA